MAFNGGAAIKLDSFTRCEMGQEVDFIIEGNKFKNPHGSKIVDEYNQKWIHHFRPDSAFYLEHHLWDIVRLINERGETESLVLRYQETLNKLLAIKPEIPQNNNKSESRQTG